MALAVRVRDLWKSFRSGWFWGARNEVLRGIELDIEEGRIFGILGPNGAGKTTLLSILSTLLLPDRGQINVLGMNALKQGNRIRERITISSGNANFLWRLTVFLEYFRSFYGFSSDLSGFLVKGYGLALVYLGLAWIGLDLVIRNAKRTGILIKLSEYHTVLRYRSQFQVPHPLIQ